MQLWEIGSRLCDYPYVILDKYNNIYFMLLQQEWSWHSFANDKTSKKIFVE